MSLRIEQDSEYQGKDYWKWRAWVEGTPDELDQVEHVVYRLHPTFANPVRTVTDRESKFRLNTAGWGTFQLRATVSRKNGTREHLSHELRLFYPDGTLTTA